MPFPICRVFLVLRCNRSLVGEAVEDAEDEG
jgi:hypothetical protein